MKKTILLIAIGAMLISTKSKAQHFIASFGTEVEWAVPQRVYYTVDHDFYGYNWVHATAEIRSGLRYFNVILQRGDVFVEVNIGSTGRIIGRTYFDYYPLNNHICNGHCGYYADYYNAHRVVCSGHSHYGHNHIVYRPAITYHAHHNHAPKGHAYGYYKNSVKPSNHYKGTREVYTKNNEPVRRDRYYGSQGSRHDRKSRASATNTSRSRSNNASGRTRSTSASRSSRSH